jgi:hypothetical protein
MNVINTTETPQVETSTFNNGPVSNETTTNPTTNPTIDQTKVAELKEKFDTLQESLRTKTYNVLLNEEQTNELTTNFYNNFTWKGYESYAVAETFEQITTQINSGTLNGNFSTEIVEATFHFIKNYEGKGVNDARVFKGICDQFALPMQEINNDRQELRDISLELVATENGISVETLVSNLQAQQNSQSNNNWDTQNY